VVLVVGRREPQGPRDHPAARRARPAFRERREPLDLQARRARVPREQQVLVVSEPRVPPERQGRVARRVPQALRELVVQPELPAQAVWAVRRARPAQVLQEQRGRPVPLAQQVLRVRPVLQEQLAQPDSVRRAPPERQVRQGRLALVLRAPQVYRARRVRMGRLASPVPRAFKDRRAPPGSPAQQVQPASVVRQALRDWERLEPPARQALQVVKAPRERLVHRA